jgi:hypothetical protein
MTSSLSPASLAEKLGALGFERVRRAIAALSLSFFAIIYFFLSFNAPPGWETAFRALSGCYLVAFFAVVAEWFWGRWFATGLGWSGLMVAVVSMVMMGWNGALAIYGLLHALVVLPLAGRSMMARYDLQEAWRQRYKMDDLSVARLRKTITRAAASLPSLILWALGPKEGGEGALLALAALGLTAAGLGGLVRLRTWGWMAVAAAAALVVSSGLLGGHLGAIGLLDVPGRDFSVLFLVAALIPFAPAAYRHFRATA